MSPAEARLKEVPSDMTEAEWNQRVNLAACYRLIAHYGWDDLVDTHISARVPGPDHHFLINPYGLMFDEITASSLVKVDLDGNQLSKSDYSINPAGFTIHSAIHEVREDAGCVLHLHTTMKASRSTTTNARACKRTSATRTTCCCATTAR
jgi:ribulose-5-phosphate 4-epimerase/fuculose-1-phosphate aldolase